MNETLFTTFVSLVIGWLANEVAQRVKGYWWTRRPLNRVLDKISDRSLPTSVVLSSVSGEKYFDTAGREIDYSYAPQEKRVTMILDARGLAYLTRVLELAKPKDILYMISQECGPDDWACNLVLLGSPLANQFTADALSFGGRYCFNQDVTAILDTASAKQYGRDSAVDHAIVARITRQTAVGMRTCVVLAGLGPAGTAGACYYLSTKYRELAKWLGQEKGALGFQVLIRVNRSAGFTVSETVERVAVR